MKEDFLINTAENILKNHHFKSMSKNFSQSQLLRFKIKKLWEQRGVKMDFETFYNIKMKQLIESIDDEIFFIEHQENFGDGLSPVEKINKIFNK